MLNKKLEKAINDQIACEFFSAYTYLAMAAYLETLDFGGIATFFAKQAEEEIGHGMKFYNYVNEKGGVVIIEWADMIEDYLQEERLEIRFKIVDEDTRVLVFKPYGIRYEELCEAIL